MVLLYGSLIIIIITTVQQRNAVVHLADLTGVELGFERVLDDSMLEKFI